MIYGQDTINKTVGGKKQGYWIHYGTERKQPGFQPGEKYEEGRYLDGRKTGIWTRHYPGGNIKSVITYKNNRAHGPYRTYYPNKMLEERGVWSHSKRRNIDTLYRYNDKGEVIQWRVFNKEGQLIKSWYLGQEPEPMILKSHTYNIDTSIHTDGHIDTITAYYKSSGCMAEWIVYDESGRELRHEYYLNNCDPERYLRGEYANRYKKPGVGSGRGITPPPRPRPPKLPGGPNGYQKIYNKNKDLWMDGQFEGGRLKNGKRYIYNQDGILQKIEVYKNFKYVGDGVIDY